MSQTTVSHGLCPECGTAVAGCPACPGCALPLTGPEAEQLVQVAAQIARLQRHRRELVMALRGRAAAPMPAAPPPDAWAPPPAVRPAVRPAPRREWTPQRVQNVILVTGVLVTLAAAVIFTAFQWGGLPLWARGALMVGATAVTGYGARYVHGRGLTSSAEAIGVLAVALGAVDAYAVHAAGLAGDVSGATYWTVASAVLAGGAAAFARVVPVRGVRYAALLAAQVPVWITVARDNGWTGAQRAVPLGAQAAVLLLAATRLGGTVNAARAFAAGNWLAGGLAALASAYGLHPRAGALALVLIAGVPLLWRLPDPTVPTALTTVTLVLAAVAPARAGLTDLQLPAAVAAVGLFVVVAAAMLPRPWRDGPLATGGATVLIALASVAPAVLTALLAPLGWLEQPWTLTGAEAARDALAPAMAWNGTVVTLGAVVVAAVTAAVVGVLADERVLRAAYVLAATAIVLVPLDFALSFRAAIAWNVAAGAAALAAAVATRRRAAALTGCVPLAVAAVWSLAHDTTTVAVTGALVVVFAAVAAYAVREEAAAVSAASAGAFAVSLALSRGTPVDRTGFVLATTAATLLAASLVLRVRSVAAVAVAAYAVALALASGDAGWLAWTLALGTAGSAVRAAKDPRVAPAAAALGTAFAGVGVVALGWPADRAAFVVTLCAAATVAAGALLRHDALEQVAVPAYVVAVAVALASSDPGWLSWVLAAGGVTVLADAIRPERRQLAWLGGALLTGCSWTRLELEGVRAPEAYAAPLAATSLLFGHLRRRANASVGSWSAYGGGLSLAFGPSLWLVLTEPGLARPLLLAVAATAVLLAGISERLQAPLAIGACVLVVDALVQVGPYAAALPKWATLGAAGLLVIAVGVTYEDRRRDVERLRRTYDSLG